MRLVILFFILNFSCSSYKHASKDCQNYIHFIKREWKLANSEKLLYSFKDKSTQWKFTQNNITTECFKGLKRRQVEKLLGEPSKMIKFYNGSFCFYCFDETCLKALRKHLTKSKQLQISYDRDGKVQWAVFSPIVVE